MGGFLIVVGFVAFAVGGVALMRGHLGFARITTRTVAAAVTAGGFAVMMVGAAASPKSSTHHIVSASGAATTAKPAPHPAAGSSTSVSQPTTPSTTAAPTTVAPTTAPAPTAPPTTQAPPPPPPTAAPQTQAPVTAAPATPPPTANLCGAPQNPMGYNYCGRGSLIVSPDPHTCSYFSCIQNFYNGSGYMEECNDGMVSMSGGRRGACSYHGGEQRPVYSG